MSRQCIFCRELKENIMPEHVFPAAIGGGFIINNVCGECNQLLGKNIDNPFTRFEMVSFYRKQFNISRINNQKRKIPNPLKGKHIGKDGNIFRAEIDENGLTTKLIPKYEEPTRNEDKTFTANVVMSASDFTNEEDAIEKFAKKYKLDVKASGLKVAKINYFNSPQPDIQLKLIPDPFILGTLKIAYEIASTFIPNYFLDDTAKRISSILLEKNIVAYKDEMYDTDLQIRDVFIHEFSEIKNLQVFHHAVILKTFPNVGLCCGVRIFNWIYSFKLSNKIDYLNCTKFALVNNAISGKFSCDIPLRITNCKYTCDISDLNRTQKRILREVENGKVKFHGKHTSIYNEKGDLVYKSMYELGKNKKVSIEYINPNSPDILVPLDLPRRKYFLKTKQNILVPLSHINFTYNFGL